MEPIFIMASLAAFTTTGWQCPTMQQKILYSITGIGFEPFRNCNSIYTQINYFTIINEFLFKSYREQHSWHSRDTPIQRHRTNTDQVPGWPS
jgi:hypothetical protein